MTTNFYAYIHCKPDGVPFYVGKGHGKRSHSMNNRSRWHKGIVKKYGPPLVAVLPCSTETTSFELEKGLIKCLRRSGVVICNLTDGGEGSSGYVTSDEAKQKIAKAITGIKRSEEFKAKMREIGKVRGFSESAKKARQVAIRGRVQSVEEKELRASKLRGKKRPDVALKVSATLRLWWAERSANKKAALPEGVFGVCTKCKEPKTKEQFSKDSTKKDGVKYMCKECGRLATAAYRAKQHATK